MWLELAVWDLALARLMGPPPRTQLLWSRTLQSNYFKAFRNKADCTIQCLRSRCDFGMMSAAPKFGVLIQMCWTENGTGRVKAVRGYGLGRVEGCRVQGCRLRVGRFKGGELEFGGFGGVACGVQGLES